MSWRSVQLRGDLCAQDEKILRLFERQPVRYVGNDIEFANHLVCDDESTNLILVINRDVWCSEILQALKSNMIDVTTFYISINRYRVLGNDTSFIPSVGKSRGEQIVDFISHCLAGLGFTIDDFGLNDDDRGKMFNFIQPLTWTYGHQAPNTSSH